LEKRRSKSNNGTADGQLIRGERPKIGTFPGFFRQNLVDERHQGLFSLALNRCQTDRRFNNDVPFTLIDTLGSPARPRGFGCCPHATLLPAFGGGLGGLAG
jgi:hypothetical protein